ncbi:MULTISPECIES: DEAD/DEAH box helicase family protein [Empedobacter]|uniref:DEAD/DEAH box helicase family protein n=1 Tax=Empedobacter TaxID=59734 RepID=UPI00257847B2|nr:MULTISPECIES: DEAD/DEAH box helicase family protein [Empedobacter]MDM1041684.1 DEAD/DEAH box helicase family protein [Empedobacter brevis]MDM1135182.1 DEAD/DEAH box helicase family protein [Empedobacter sp. R750]
MANFHEKLVLNKYMLSLFGIDSIGKKIIGKNGVEIFTDLKLSSNEGYTEEGNTKYLQSLISHMYNSEYLTATMLQTYDENIVRYTKQISEKRSELITWKYFQYLSLLFTEVYLDKYFQNKVKLLADLNEFVNEFNLKQAEAKVGKKKGKDTFVAQPFTLESLNKLAFWNATGSGKTLLMHINIKQYLHYANHYNQHHQNKVLLITPNEGLTKQHLEEFKLSDIRANNFSKNDSGMFSGKQVEILEITKLAENSGDKTVAVESFETDNLVLIDEGHGGMSGDSWKRFRDQLSLTGFAFEYSATFGQAINAASGAKKTEFTQEYAKSILFDYSYKYFYEDGYGKDYRILNLKEDNTDYQQLYLTANLVSFFQQQLLYKEKKSELRDFLLHKPLWIFVGGKVNAVRKEGGKEVSDVLEIIYFLTDFLKNPSVSIQNIDTVINNKAGLVNSKGYSIFEHSFTYINEQKLDANTVFNLINELVFNNTTIGANLYLDNLKGADGELGLRVGDNDYFGVINVGDEKKLHDLAINNKVLGTERDFSDSLFKMINEESSSINLLIGSKKFSEGWSSWRVSSMGLMNVGKSEGSQIIQLFGRGVRLKGYNFSLKRSTGLDEYQKPNNIKILKKYLRHLETLQIFGVKADYMEKFKEFLEEEGLPINDSSWITIKVPTIQKEIVQQNKLKLIAVKDSENFKQKVIVPLIYNASIFNGKLVELDWYPKIDVLEKNNSGVAITKNEAILNDSHLSIINWNSVYLELHNFKADKGYHNLKIELEQLQDIMHQVSWYKLLIPEHKVNFSQFSNTFIWQELVITLLKKYIEQFYLFYKNEFSSDHVEAIQLTGSDDNFVLEYDFRLNTEEEIEDYQNKIEQLKLDVVEPAFTNVQIGSEIDAFDNLLHLYKPLVYVGKGYKEKLQVSPIPLDASEKQFLDDLITYVGTKPASLEGKDIHVLRNQSKKGLGFFTDGNNFYPDFIVWIVEGDKQIIKFIDPKGIRNSKGINDPKIQFYKVLKDKIQPQVQKANIELDSYIVSNTSYLDVNWKDTLSIEDFNKNHVYFQKENVGRYIGEILVN